MSHVGRVGRIYRNPRWYAGMLLARARDRIGPQTNVDYRECFAYARTMLASQVLSPIELPREAGLTTDRMPDDSKSLVALLDAAGSDKGSRQGYGDLYQSWAEARLQPVRMVVEIGLGSPSGLTPSNMGPEARPGASLRAFAEYFPTATLLGADIDPEAFTSHPRITCFIANQLRPPTFGAILGRLASVRGFDLAVIDGLHTPEADLNSLLLLLPWLRPGGLLCVEDIGLDELVILEWTKLLSILPDPWVGQLHRLRLSHLVTIARA